jgi:hypothetical protein
MRVWSGVPRSRIAQSITHQIRRQTGLTFSRQEQPRELTTNASIGARLLARLHLGVKSVRNGPTMG